MLTEFGLIDIAKSLASKIPQNGFEGIGDDCAILNIGEDEALVFTTDLVVEDVHFLRREYTPEQVAHKSLNVNLSDVASMGVKPVATLLSVALPREVMSGDWAERFITEYTRLSKLEEVALIGGDTTASKDKIVINVVAIGRGSTSNIKRREDAKEGDIIYVCGELGGSAAGLKDILEGSALSRNAAIHKSPNAQIQEGIWLGAREEVHAMMDISDGIASDLKHIVQRSGVGAEIELRSIPKAEGATLEDALCGGEDYKLLLTADSSQAEVFEKEFEKRFGYKPYRIGRVCSGDKISWLDGSQLCDCEWQGFVHY